MERFLLRCEEGYVAGPGTPGTWTPYPMKAHWWVDFDSAAAACRRAAEFLGLRMVIEPLRLPALTLHRKSWLY